jgi:6,7-dimethyl-8-ribityllumazine synthase
MNVPEFDKKPRVLVLTGPGTGAGVTDAARGVLVSARARVEVREMPAMQGGPAAVAIAARSGDYDGFVVLGRCGAKQRGRVAAAVMALGTVGVCVGYALVSRKKPRGHKKAEKAALVALHLVALSRKRSRQSGGVGFRPASEHILIADTTPDGPDTA